MKYTDQNARWFAIQHGLSPKTELVWKHRHIIPDSYAKGKRGRTPAEPIVTLKKSAN